MFAGVPGLAATLLCAIAFALFTWQVLANGPLRRWDEAAGDALRAAPPPREAAELLADLGNLSVALPLLALAMALTLRHSRGRDWWPVLCYALAMGVMAPLVTGLKAWVDRTGPLGGGGFFPSGHAATTAVALGAAALLLTGRLPALAVRAVWAAAAILTVGNGLGLVWRGYHWPLDVAASWCLGVLLLAAADAAARRGSPLSGRGLIRR
ncbi:phosphatase PAP2 family protein [Streptomyces sp. NBC_01795]|uniref:phosphatase PAP2 family protein n=1 Tax=Streptomyces sp. NBC_01795 TaxID=2975943 RepID=UPI002DDBF07A|nr:phosphatase PAP2 family protein [Streptomyces sp. NBC_01795]WSA92069.1 phosphatase PAP2 family protein [Streptomyces sp. NBC_01795]